MKRLWIIQAGGVTGMNRNISRVAAVGGSIAGGVAGATAGNISGKLIKK